VEEGRAEEIDPKRAPDAARQKLADQKRKTFVKAEGNHSLG
jgi:hypothetical protein